MGLKEIFTGGPKVKEAQDVITEFGQRKRVTNVDQKRLDVAKDITRRHFLKISGVAGLVLVGGSVLGSLALNELFPKPESDDEVRNSYEDSFRKLAAGDPRGEKLISFYKDGARKGHYEGESVIADEVGLKGKNFIVAVVDADWDSLVLPQPNSAASYN